MNLVKAQEYAQSLPLAELKKYADGFNPSMIPPWLATGEMQAKMKRAEMANTLQGAATGPQPSVKEQVEQKAGIMALQQAQQQAQAQQMMQPRMGAGPVPEGTPRPNPQPQPGLDQLPSNIQMAGGGIVAFATGNAVKAGPEFIKFLQSMGIDYADFVKSSASAQDNIKDMFRATQGSQPAAAAPTPQTVQGNANPKAYQAGQKAASAINAAKAATAGKVLPGLNAGIAAYEGLSDVSDAKEFYDDPNVPMSEKVKQFARTGSRTALPIAGGTAGSLVSPGVGTVGGALAGQGLAALIDREGEALAKWRASQAAGQKDNQSAAETARLNATAPAVEMGNEGRRAGPVAEGVGINVSPNLIPANVRPAAKPQPRPEGNVPQNVNPNTVNAPAAPAAPAADSMEALFREALKNKPKERSIQDLINEQNAIRVGTGLGEEAGKAKLERIADLKQQYAATQMTPMDELISMLGQAGQYKGLSGLAPAYTSMAEKKRAADLAQAKQIHDLMSGVEDTQRAEKIATAGKVSEGRAKDIENMSLRDREMLKVLEGARGQDVQSASSKYSADMHYKSAMAQIRATAAREGLQQQRLLLDTFKAELATIDKELAPLLKAPFGPAKAQIAELQARKAGLTKALDEASGISKMVGAPGAASPGGTTRMRFDAQGNPIK